MAFEFLISRIAILDIKNGSGAGSGTPAKTVDKNYLAGAAGLLAIQPQIVPIRPCLNICQFSLTGGFVAGWDD